MKVETVSPKNLDKVLGECNKVLSKHKDSGHYVSFGKYQRKKNRKPRWLDVASGATVFKHAFARKSSELEDAILKIDFESDKNTFLGIKEGDRIMIDSDEIHIISKAYNGNMFLSIRPCVKVNVSLVAPIFKSVAVKEDFCPSDFFN